MTPLRDETIARMIEWIGPPTDEIVAEMEDWAAREGFSTVGPEVGRMLALCARLLGARDVFGLGFGFGHPADWIVRTLPAGGRFVLTERDADVLGAARSAFERGDLADRAVFEEGNAIETAEKYDHQGESFDLVVLDHDTAGYVRGFDTVRGLVVPDGAVVADNVLATENTAEVLSPAGLLATLDGERAPNDRTSAVADFYERVEADPAFETYVLPVGEGLVVACKV